jgi:hypothetical protein
VYENRELGRIFGPKEEEVKKDEEKYVSGFIIFIYRHIL